MEPLPLETKDAIFRMTCALHALFPGQAPRITVLVRFPDDEAGRGDPDYVMTDDDLEDAAYALQRFVARERTGQWEKKEEGL